LADETSYVQLQQDLSISLLDFISSQTAEESTALRQFFAHPGVFDGLVSVLVQELNKKPMRPHLCDPNARQ